MHLCIGQRVQWKGEQAGHHQDSCYSTQMHFSFEVWIHSGVREMFRKSCV
jgi:hypothetical protein